MDGTLLVIPLVILFGIAARLFIKTRQIGSEAVALRTEKSRLEAQVINLRNQNEAVSQQLSLSGAENGTLELERTRLDANMSALAEENRALSQYRPIMDLEGALKSTRDTIAAEATRSRKQMDEERRQAIDAINSRMTAASRESEVLIVEAHEQAARISTEAATQLKTAQQESTAIVKQAHERALEIAGEALEAKTNLETYKREALALKNLVVGYGHEYLVPVHSLLDDLAEAFGFAEAGEKLKAARERTRALVKEERAATCDYVEANRRETAVAFVVDAFNGKVDSILARVKADNAGKLRQEVLDAHALVNLNGRAFRQARIEKDYLDSRLEELRWAAVAHELKNQEKEEQRRIKEQIREEEKARREYERAMKDATKEEDTIKKTMDRVRKEVEKAGEAQRAKYEAQLQELSSKLQLAEEKNQRALSMAQQTRTGHVYVISNVGSFGDEVFKIGLTRRLEPLDRIRELGDASVPFEFDVHALIASDDAPALERSLHRHFLASQINKVNPRKEFFRVPLRVIRDEMEKLGVHASWTMAAEAAEYRESMAIEAAIKENPGSFDAWVNKQLVLDPVVFDEAGEDGAAAAAE
jgi:chromosome segregation ATPase